MNSKLKQDRCIHPSQALFKAKSACAARSVQLSELSLLRREMLTYIRSAVTRNASEKKINSLLDFVAQSTNMNLLQASACSLRSSS